MTGEGPDGGRAHGAACQWQGIERTAVATVLRFRAPHGLPSSAPAFALRRAVASCLPGPCHRATGDGCLPSSRERCVWSLVWTATRRGMGRLGRERSLFLFRRAGFLSRLRLYTVLHRGFGLWPAGKYCRYSNISFFLRTCTRVLFCWGKRFL